MEGEGRVIADEAERAAVLALPESRRKERAEEEFDKAEERIRSSHKKALEDAYGDGVAAVQAKIDAELRAAAAKIADRFGIKRAAQPITGF